MSTPRLTFRNRSTMSNQGPAAPAASQIKKNAHRGGVSAAAGRGQSSGKRFDPRERFELALPGTNELLARFEHALAMNMIQILGRR